MVMKITEKLPKMMKGARAVIDCSNVKSGGKVLIITNTGRDSLLV